MDQKVKERVSRHFGLANKVDVVYVVGEKLFADEGAARSYGKEVVVVKRSEVKPEEAPVVDGDEGACPVVKSDGDEKKNPKIEA